MADVSKIRGPAGSPDTPEKKDQTTADADKFNEALRKREVTAVDPDQQKKRKQSGELSEEEENLSVAPPAPTTPASQVTPFSMEADAKRASPHDLQGGGAGISPLQSAHLATQPSPPSLQAPQGANDSEGEAFGSSAAPQQQAQKWAPEGQEPIKAGPPESNQPQQQQTQKWTPEGQEPVKAGPPGSSQPYSRQQQQQTQSPQGPPQDKKGLSKAEQQTVAVPIKMQPTTREEKKPLGSSAASLEGEHPPKVQDTTLFFEQMGEKGEDQGQKEHQEAKIQEDAIQQGLGPVTAATVPVSQPLEEEKEKKPGELEPSASIAAAGVPTGGTPQMVAGPPPALETLPSYTHMHPQVQEMFDRMVGVMTVMTLSGMTETVITLNTPQFGSSVFFGTQIIIQEFSTAPHAFNIQLNGTPQALALFQGNADDLMAAFQAGKYNFRVNRLETGYLADRPLFRRKGEASGKDQQQSNENSK